MITTNTWIQRPYPGFVFFLKIIVRNVCRSLAAHCLTIFVSQHSNQTPLRLKQGLETHGSNQKAMWKPYARPYFNANDVANARHVKSPEAKAEKLIFRTAMRVRRPERNSRDQLVTTGFRPSVAYRLISGFKGGRFSVPNRVIGTGDETEMSAWAGGEKMQSFLYRKNISTAYGNDLLLIGHVTWPRALSGATRNHNEPHGSVRNPWQQTQTPQKSMSRCTASRSQYTGGRNVWRVFISL